MATCRLNYTTTQCKNEPGQKIHNDVSKKSYQNIAAKSAGHELKTYYQSDVSYVQKIVFVNTKSGRTNTSVDMKDKDGVVAEGPATKATNLSNNVKALMTCGNTAGAARLAGNGDAEYKHGCDRSNSCRHLHLHHLNSIQQDRQTDRWAGAQNTNNFNRLTSQQQCTLYTSVRK